MILSCFCIRLSGFCFPEQAKPPVKNEKREVLDFVSLGFCPLEYKALLPLANCLLVLLAHEKKKSHRAPSKSWKICQQHQALFKMLASLCVHPNCVNVYAVGQIGSSILPFILSVFWSRITEELGLLAITITLPAKVQWEQTGTLNVVCSQCLQQSQSLR